MTARRVWLSFATMALACGPERPVAPTSGPQPTVDAVPPAVELWTSCESHFNLRELDELTRCFGATIDFSLATTVGVGRDELGAHLAELIERNSTVRLSTKLAMYRGDIITGAVMIEGWGDEPSARLALFVAALDDGVIEALRLHMDPFMPGRRAPSLRYPALGRVPGRPLTDEQLRWVSALSKGMGSKKGPRLPLATNAVLHHPTGDLRGKAIDSLLRAYVEVTAMLDYRAIPVLATDEWVVVEGEWIDREGSFRVQGLLARVVNGTAREIWFFDPMLSALSFGKGLENLPPRH